MKNPLIYLVRKMWEYSKGNHAKVIIYAALSSLSILILALEPVVVGKFLNTVQSAGVHSDNVRHLITILSLLILIEIGFWATHGPSRILEFQNAFWVRAAYKNYLLEGTMALPLEWHADHHSGDTIDKIEKGSTALYNFCEKTFEVIQGVITLLTAFVIMFFFDAFAATVAIAITGGTFYILTKFDKKLVPGYKLVSRMENTTSSKVFDALSNVTTVIILRVEALVLASLEVFIRKPFQRFDKNNKISESKWFFSSICGRVLVIAVVGLYLMSHLVTGTILVGTVYILYGYANQIRDTFFKFTYLYNDIVRFRASVSNAEELSKDFREVAGPKNKLLPKNWSVITIENLSFSYHTEDGADPHLDDLSFELKRGERMAFIGESGGGKTTLLKVIRDLYHPKTLNLAIDGKICKNGFRDLSESISLIPQDPEVFATTIRENITLGVDYTDEHIEVFTDMASFTEVVKTLPKKLESSIVEKGVNLSGGEKQRLALARGLLASVDKDIILLDEPTSSVDFHNELEIYKNIFEAFPQKTIISSIHRLHLLSLFDRIFFFKEGKIIATGSFDELQETSKDFQVLWEKYIKTRDN